MGFYGSNEPGRFIIQAMPSPLPYSRPLFWILIVFAATAVASVALQNLVWVAVLLFFFAHWKSGQKVDWPRGLFPVATLLFLITFFIGAILGADPANSFHTVHKYLALLMIFPLGAMALTSDQVRKLLLAFLYGAAFCALAGIGKHFILHQDRIDSFSGDKMVFGGMLMVSLLFLLYFLSKSPKDPWLWTSTVLVGTALLFTQTRGAWIGFLPGLVLLLWKFGRKWLLIGLLLMAGSFFILPTPLQERVKSVTELNLTYDGPPGVMTIINSSQTRVLIWVSGLKMIQAHPWGVGQGNVEKEFPKYRLYTLSGVENTVPHLHDNFLQILAQNGWLGLAVYLLWIFSYYRTAVLWKGADLGMRGLNWAFLSAFTAVLVWGLTEYTFSHQFMNIQFFLLGLQLNLWKNNAGFQSMNR